MLTAWYHQFGVENFLMLDEKKSYLTKRGDKFRQSTSFYYLKTKEAHMYLVSFHSYEDNNFISSKVLRGKMGNLLKIGPSKASFI